MNTNLELTATAHGIKTMRMAEIIAAKTGKTFAEALRIVVAKEEAEAKARGAAK